MLAALAGCQSDHATFTLPEAKRAAAPRGAVPTDSGWADRRPIFQLVLSMPSYRDRNPVKNPNGFNDYWYGDLDHADPEFPARFRKQFDAFFDNCVERTVKGGGQGIIVKDVRGSRREHANTYDGDPVNELTDISKEQVKGWADKCKAKGLWLGFLVRNTINVRGMQAVAWDSAATFIDKVKEAKETYGLDKTAVDFDSNVEAGAICSAAYMQRVRKAVGPDVLIVAEFWAPGYDEVPGLCAVAHDPRHPGLADPPQDSTFTLLFPLDAAKWDALYTAWYAKQLRQGAIPLMTANYDSLENALVEKQMRKAGKWAGR